MAQLSLASQQACPGEHEAPLPRHVPPLEPVAVPVEAPVPLAVDDVPLDEAPEPGLPVAAVPEDVPLPPPVEDVPFSPTLLTQLSAPRMTRRVAKRMQPPMCLPDIAPCGVDYNRAGSPNLRAGTRERGLLRVFLLRLRRGQGHGRLRQRGAVVDRSCPPRNRKAQGGDTFLGSAGALFVSGMTG